MEPSSHQAGTDDIPPDEIPIGNSPPRPIWWTVVAGVTWAFWIVFLFVIAMNRT
ncbi:MAG: hypothetical protein ACE5E5_06035 [Phycisphaerae bacterium]